MGIIPLPLPGAIVFVGDKGNVLKSHWAVCLSVDASLNLVRAWIWLYCLFPQLWICPFCFVTAIRYITVTLPVSTIRIFPVSSDFFLALTTVSLAQMKASITFCCVLIELPFNFLPDKF